MSGIAGPRFFFSRFCEVCLPFPLFFFVLVGSYLTSFLSFLYCFSTISLTLRAANIQPPPASIGYDNNNNYRRWGDSWGEDGYFKMKRGTDDVAVESMSVAAKIVLPV